MKKLVQFVVVAVLWLNYATPLLASPPSESCPSDSTMIADTCKCDVQLCSKPACLSTLSVATNGSDLPGSCCPTYTCDNCTSDARIDGKCPCAIGATLNTRGECRCVDPEMSLENGTCVCNADLCPLPHVCDEKSVLVSEQGGCCTKTTCIPCPEDSFPSGYNSELLDDKCVCYQCKPVTCGAKQTPVIRRHGKNFPGHCCDLYDCVNATSKVCVVDNVTYHEGETWKTLDTHVCKCQNGISLCASKIFDDADDEALRPCHVDDNIYKHSETWMADSCTNCTCINGERKCIAEWCDINVSQVKRVDCQPLVNCKKSCPNGFKVNKRGCEICKCNAINYAEIFESYLRDKFNISVDELTLILDNYKKQSLSTTVAPETTITTISSLTSSTSDPVTTTNTTTKLPSTTVVSDKMSHSDNNNILIYWPYFTPLIVVVIAIVVAVVLRKYHKTASYDTSTTNVYEPIKTKQNNNIIKDHSSIKLYDKP